MHTMLAPPHFGEKGCLQWRSIATPLVELKKVLADYNTSSLLWRTRKQSDQKENRVDDAPQSIHGLRLHRICTESLTTVVVLGAIIGEMIRKQKHAQTATPLAAAAADDDDRCCCHYYDLHCDGTKFTKQHHAFAKQVSTIGKPRQTSVQPPHNPPPPPPPHIDRRLRNFPQRSPKKIVMRKGKEHRGTAIVIVLERQREHKNKAIKHATIQEGQEENKPRADTKKPRRTKPAKPLVELLVLCYGRPQRRRKRGDFWRRSRCCCPAAATAANEKS